ncbi:MAG: ABC transporter permease [Anaerolineae bacterium]|nr:ABC transporter permease [Anaerolineae bacterium]
MRKIITLAWKELYIVFTDRNLLVIMIAAPLAIATIIGLAFGGQGGDIPVRDIPVAIVNLDEGGANEQNFGSIFVSAFVRPADGAESAQQALNCPTSDAASDANAGSSTTLYDLTEAVEVADVETARAGVDAGTYTAAIIIPADFTAKLGYGQNDPIEAAAIEVYANSGRAVGAAIIRSIVEGIGNQLATGSIAAATTVDSVVAEYGFAGIGQVAGSEAFQQNIACAFTPAINVLTIDQQTIAGERPNSTAAILVLFGSAQAMFFMLFTGQQGVLSIFDERRDGTLQRLVVSPTPRLYILIGKLAGTFVTCLMQMIALFVFLTLVGSLLTGQLTMIWGNNLFLVAVMLIAAAIASTGLGTLLAGIARTQEQSAIFAQLINLAMALLGGAFGFQLPEAISRFSIIYWGTNAFQKLAANQTDIGLNLLVLFGFGIGLFAIGFWFFNRRLDI